MVMAGERWCDCGCGMAMAGKRGGVTMVVVWLWKVIVV